MSIATNPYPPTNPYLLGNSAPVPDEVTAFDLPVTGTIPAELTGRYLRNGPNPAGDPDPMRYHWFLGDGMVHGIRLEAGAARWYRNRWVRSPSVADAMGVEPPPTDLDPAWTSLSPNTNVVSMGGRTLALVEAGFAPYELTDELETIGPTDLDGTLERSFSAHTKVDPATGEGHLVAYWWGWESSVRYLKVGTDGRVEKTIDVAVPGGPMIHDTAITERWAVVLDLPVTFDLELATVGGGFPYGWNPDYGARVGLLPLDATTDETRWFEIDPCYIFHPLNAYDDGDRVVLDAVRHEATFDTDHHGPDEGLPTLDRWTFDTSTGVVTEERLDDRGLELPRLDERRIGRPNRYGYAVCTDDRVGYGHTTKLDLDRGTRQVREHGPGRWAGEPVFVPRTPDAAEDDGWLMALVYDTDRNGSDLVIWSAQDFLGPAEAVVELPQRVPWGFHGNWIPDPI